ncbi:MAG: VWA domain-containing protein [Armatimonadota bacterium]|nr:VWA domain-containing protein [Armatimonadota bacterium]MDR7519345.1 VWA domain-containing protein [Armatimonadota bacterium]
MVEFLWPGFLAGFALLPLLVAAYARWIRRPVPRVVTYPDATTVLAATGQGRRWRRHLGAGLFLIGLAAVITALGRPTFPIPVPADRAAIMLVIDISGSMRSTDIEPNRLEAAKAAAKIFLDDLPDQVRVGLVTFGGYATLVAPPGTPHDRIKASIDGLNYFIRRTAIGAGLLEAMAALPGRGRPGPDGTLPSLPTVKRPPGIIILLSDGRSNTGIDAVRAAEMARAQEVTIHTIGVGQTEWRPGAFMIGGALDETELRAVANAGGGTYHHASSASALKDVYRSLARSVGWERRPDEVSAVFALTGAVVLAGALVIRQVTSPLGF